MKTVKIIISLVLIIALISSFVSVTSYAAVDPVTAIGASGLAALIASLLGIDYISNNISPSELTNFFKSRNPDNPDYVSFVLDVINNPTGTVSMFINKEFFKWLIGTNENVAQEFNLVDNSSALLESGIGKWSNIPIYSNNKSSTYILNRGTSNTTGDIYLSNYGGTYQYLGYKTIYEQSIYELISTLGATNFPLSYNFSGFNGTNAYLNIWSPNGYRASISISGSTSLILGTFSLNAETGNIDFTVADDIPSTGGVSITAPAPSEPLDLQELIEYLLQLFIDQSEDLELEIVDEEPGPDYGPLIPETPYSTLENDLIGLFRSLGNKIEDVVQDVIGLSGTLTNTIEEGFTDVIGLFEDVGETITDIYDTVVEKVGSIDISLDSILEAVQSIAQSIETAAVDLFSDFLSAIQAIFAPILGRIRSALGIWHYVVEWLNCIGGVFTWIFGLCSGTAYCMVVPIYASIAAAICIALYKRFGR